MDEILLQQNMTDSQRFMFQAEMAKLRKNKTVAILLCFFLGGIGGHKYYMGEIGWGVAYTLFCWTFIPGIVAFVELFLMSGRVDRFNQQTANEVAAKITTFIPERAAA